MIVRQVTNKEWNGGRKKNGKKEKCYVTCQEMEYGECICNKKIKSYSPKEI